MRETIDDSHMAVPRASGGVVQYLQAKNAACSVEPNPGYPNDPPAVKPARNNQILARSRVFAGDASPRCRNLPPQWVAKSGWRTHHSIFSEILLMVDRLYVYLPFPPHPRIPFHRVECFACIPNRSPPACGAPFRTTGDQQPRIVSAALIGPPNLNPGPLRSQIGLGVFIYVYITMLYKKIAPRYHGCRVV